ncbi:hypothetical protein KV102_09935 [Mumia sp. zg.B53]|uniref:hypothetical protein n=1 Tax=unclassified Mumia TaxID=2621872 RepID=UPI001C6DEB1F|nr:MULTISPECIES: hypothetical protein [unclassified Mumia]MBW9207118.1 hypothetical protein [Mumia sp. zg.B17]MBW9210546.1 hypothetical protein [Mumia sp. zg.B21]MBW9215158.1 hypothetical protein [Mumia sp. zg.B53]
MAFIELSGAGLFELAIEGGFGLIEIDDCVDSWDEVFRLMVRLSVSYFDGEGEWCAIRPIRGRTRHGLRLAVEGDSYLLEGPTFETSS